ncbi:MAG: hypothetical protein ACD_44C00072G0009 [uncultured bacterium]|nr:MAG: hypothetical protein ACD_44C00072G0009 [uncultured bacterium]
MLEQTEYFLRNLPDLTFRWAPVPYPELYKNWGHYTQPDHWVLKQRFHLQSPEMAETYEHRNLYSDY